MIAGGAAVAVVVVVAAVIIFLLLRRRRREKGSMKSDLSTGTFETAYSLANGSPVELQSEERNPFQTTKLK